MILPRRDDRPAGPDVSPATGPRLRLPFGLYRSPTDRVLAGVAGGLGERLEIDPVLVRLAFVVLAFAGGFGIALYLLGWLVAPEGPAAATASPAAGAAPSTVERETAERETVERETAAQAPTRSAPRTLAVACVVAGVLLLLREAGLWFGDAVVGSVGLAAFGSALIWARSDDAGRARWARMAARLPRSSARGVLAGEVSRGRIAGGTALVVGGMAIFLAANTTFSALRTVAFGVLVTAAGLGLVLGPWMYRLGLQLGEERRERIRSQERAEMAAHLHDSVLQTLALIQRTGDPQEMATLARGQERELRTWLYGRRGPAVESGPSGETLSEAVEAAAARVERLHGARVEVVTVGDHPLDDRLRAVVDAAGEAMSNAARHSGAPTVSVYVEAGPDAVDAYVRDQGKGFDLDRVPPERRGIAESIRGRMERNGGAATIATEPGEGTEVHLRMPLPEVRP